MAQSAALLASCTTAPLHRATAPPQDPGSQSQICPTRQYHPGEHITVTQACGSLFLLCRFPPTCRVLVVGRPHTCSRKNLHMLCHPCHPMVPFVTAGWCFPCWPLVLQAEFFLHTTTSSSTVLSCAQPPIDRSPAQGLISTQLHTHMQWARSMMLPRQDQQTQHDAAASRNSAAVGRSPKRCVV